MNKELLQQVLDALENSSDLVFKDLSKSYLRELAVNTLREAIAQPEQPAAPVAPIPALPESDDTALLNKLQSLAEDGHVSICFEFDGGFHVTHDPVGGEQIAAREKETVRDGIRWHLTSKLVCSVPPFGWECSRQAGHDGPCAARRTKTTGEGS